MTVAKRLVGRRLATTLLASSILIGLSPGVASASEPPLSPRTRSIQGEIIGYYKFALNRAPDVGGFRVWVNAAAGNCYPRFGGVPSAIWNSREFRSRGLTRSQRVQTLYQGLLARRGSSGEVARYVSALNRGSSWASVVSSFANSSEYRGRVSSICVVHRYPRLFIGEANQLLTGMTFSMWLRHRKLRMQVTDPYNWSTNGCNVIPDQAMLFDYRVCWRHDWGYRNYGGGLRLDRTEARRKIIDDVLRKDMKDSCRRYTTFSKRYLSCMVQAEEVYFGVRQFGEIFY